MKRDMDLVRKILFDMEDYPHGYYQDRQKLVGYDPEQMGFHATLMVEAGLIDGTTIKTPESQSPATFPSRITWKGYEFLDACRDEERWITAKEIMGKVKGASFDIMMMILTELMKKQILGL